MGNPTKNSTKKSMKNSMENPMGNSMKTILKIDNIEKYYGNKSNMTKAIDTVQHRRQCPEWTTQEDVHPSMTMAQEYQSEI